MILLGVRDLNGREITEILTNSAELIVDKKIKDEFECAKADSLQEQPLDLGSFKNDPRTEHIENLPPFLRQQYSRSIMLSLATYIMQHRAIVSCKLLEQLVSKLNSDLTYNKESYSELLTATFESISDKERSLLEKNERPILSRANLILYYFWTKLFNEFHKLETCAFMEGNKVSFNFLSELEKSNYEDRRLAKILNIYRNYFKKRTSDKNEPPASLYEDIFLSCQLDNQVQVMEKMVTSLLSFERKPYLQNKMVSESDCMVFYSKNIDCIFQEIAYLCDKIRQAKGSRGKVGASSSQIANRLLLDGIQHLFYNNTLYTLVDNFVDDLSRMAWMVKRQSAENQKMVQSNPKFKPKASESWQLVDSLLGLSQPATTEEKISENDFALSQDQILAVVNGLSFAQLVRVMAEVFAPVLEQSKKPKIPKGTRDYTPLQMTIKSQAIAQIRKIYQKHGAEEIDTPIFELKETLLGKYGEEGGKLIYDLEDQGGELLSLRYDLTVPFARYMGLNNLTKMKRFHIGKVYRRDQPNINKGRFREFFQCDLDIAGKTDPMLAEAEVLKIIAETLASFDLKFKIKVSHRLLLEAMIECAKCDLKKFKMICSSIDKLDKEPWEAVEKELIYDKGLTPEQTQVLKSFVLHRGNIAAVIELANSQKLFGDNPKAKTSLAEMSKLQSYIKLFKVDDVVEFDLSLARGLDYYTGLIFEAVLLEGETALGSIAGGGRYDELIGMFSKDAIPAMGGSIGIERLFVILEEKYKSKCRASSTEFLIGSIGKSGTLDRKMEIINEFWEAGLNTEFVHDEYPRPDKQLKFALERRIPFILWVGEDEVKANVFKIKNLYMKKEISVPGEELVATAKELSATYQKDLEDGKVVFEE